MSRPDDDGPQYVSLDAVRWASAQRPEGGQTRAVLARMAMRVADKPMRSRCGQEWPRHHFWMSLDRLVEASGFDERTVRKALESLVAGGFIERVGNEGDNNRTVVYRLVIHSKNVLIDAVPMGTDLQVDPDIFVEPLIKAREGTKHKGESRERAAPPKFATRPKSKSQYKRLDEKKVTLAQWCAERQARGEKAIPDDDEVILKLCSERSIDRAALEAHLVAFASRYRDDDPTHCRTPEGWATLLRKSVRDNYYDALGATARATTAQPAPWHDSRSGIDAKACELGIEVWTEARQITNSNDQYHLYRAKVIQAAERAPDPAPRAATTKPSDERARGPASQAERDAIANLRRLFPSITSTRA